MECAARIAVLRADCESWRKKYELLVQTYQDAQKHHSELEAKQMECTARIAVLRADCESGRKKHELLDESWHSRYELLAKARHQDAQMQHSEIAAMRMASEENIAAESSARQQAEQSVDKAEGGPRVSARPEGGDCGEHGDARHAEGEDALRSCPERTGPVPSRPRPVPTSMFHFGGLPLGAGSTRDMSYLVHQVQGVLPHLDDEVVCEALIEAEDDAAQAVELLLNRPMAAEAPDEEGQLAMGSLSPGPQTVAQTIPLQRPVATWAPTLRPRRS
jgi:hypothetical protein